jgi:hypothetical protein
MFKARVDRVIDETKVCRKRPGVEEILIPRNVNSPRIGNIMDQGPQWAVRCVAAAERRGYNNSFAKNCSHAAPSA